MLEYRGHDGSNFRDEARAPRGSRNLDFRVNIQGAGESSAAKSKNAGQGDDRRFPIQVVSNAAGDGDVFIVVNKELRDKIGKGSGEVVEMTVGRDTSAVVVSIPADLKKALSQNAKAETSFRKMAPSHRKAYVQWIEQAKKAETRESRLKKAIHMLLQGKTMS